MSLEADIQTILVANAGLLAIFSSSRIVTYDALGDLGLNRTGFPVAFDSNGEILPTLIVRDRNANTTVAMRGEDAQIASYLQAVEIVTYATRLEPTSPATLDTALGLVYTLLHDRNAGAVRLMERNRVSTEREPRLNYCFMSWSTYDGMGLHRP